MVPADRLVSIGLPTFNRAHLLPRTLDSILAQDHARVEVIVSDNASTDGTEALCRSYAARDPRVRYLRQSSNIGPTPNFKVALAEARGSHFMWLSDDDWLDPNFISECLRAMDREPGVALVSGLCRLYDEHSVFRREDPPTHLPHPTPYARVLGYYSAVGYNSIFYGLMPTGLARQAPLENVLAGDWIFVAAMALQGKVLTTPATHLHRTLGIGTSKSVRNVVRAFGMPAYQWYMPRLTVTFNTSRALLHAPWPEGTPRGTRRCAALAVFLLLFVRYSWFRRLFPRPLRTALMRRFA